MSASMAELSAQLSAESEKVVNLTTELSNNNVREACSYPLSLPY